MLHSFYSHRSPALPRLDLSQRRRGEHGSQSRRQPRQPHDSGDCLLPEEPEEDDVLPGLQEQAVPALRYLPPQWDLRQAGQHVSNSLKGSACHVSSHGLLIAFCCCCFFYRYMELVHTDSNFEPEESFFQLFSDPRSTRLTRVQLREDFVRDRDLEAIKKQVGGNKVVRVTTPV